MSDQVRGGEKCVFHSVHVYASVDGVVVILIYVCVDTCRVRGGGIGYLRGEDDIIVAGIGGREGSK